MIKKIFTRILSTARGTVRFLLLGQMRGWKLVTLYTLSILASAGIGYVIVDELSDQLRYAEHKNLDIRQELDKKQGVAENHKRLQVQLDQVLGNKTSCVSELERQGKSGGKEKWNDCVSKPAVLARVNLFYKENEALLASYDDLDNTLHLFAWLGFEEARLDGFTYSVAQPGDNDYPFTVPVTLSFNCTMSQLLDFMKLIDEKCYNCHTQLAGLEATDKTLHARLLVEVALESEDRQFKDKLRERIRKGEYLKAAQPATTGKPTNGETL